MRGLWSTDLRRLWRADWSGTDFQHQERATVCRLAGDRESLSVLTGNMAPPRSNASDKLTGDNYSHWKLILRHWFARLSLRTMIDGIDHVFLVLGKDQSFQQSFLIWATMISVLTSSLVFLGLSTLSRELVSRGKVNSRSCGSMCGHGGHSVADCVSFAYGLSSPEVECNNGKTDKACKCTNVSKDKAHAAVIANPVARSGVF